MDHADAVDLASHDVTRLKKDLRIPADPHALRGAGGKQITRLERECGRQIRDLLPHIVDHVTGVALLAQFTIYECAQIKHMRVCDLIRSNNPWPDWTVGVERQVRSKRSEATIVR